MKGDIPVYDIQNFPTYKNDGILVSRFGYYSNQHQHLQNAHRHSFYHLVFFTSSGGQQQIDFKTVQIKPNLIYFMVPGQVHSWNLTGQPEGYLINFSTSFFSRFLLNQEYLQQFSFFSGNPEDQVVYLNQEIGDNMSLIFEEILKEGENQNPINDDLVRIALLRIFTQVARAVDGSKNQTLNTYSHTLVGNFKRFIEGNYFSLKLPKEYAALLYITPNHLNAVCNETLGVSAGKLIRDRVILEAKRLLINVDLRVSEIAERLNFEDQSYFVKFFKRYEGVTPDKFRKHYTASNERA